ncbi:TRAP transporter small permease [Pelagerythrobacter rhizovicinus]|uniref:TRAP transporter small permease protein n=2 Tax=Pelagerythrobacter rhizovicinus TaxID=2268576 RepID=A0A4Q2KLN8_9SPHN|nr:TRAP transporter small permease [Pelagerythrobacter rhizovicinus]
MLDTLKRVNRAASACLLHAGAAGLVVMTAVIGWQVFGRFVLNDSPSWAEQAALVLMIWYVFFAAAAGVREGFHIRIVAVQSALPPSVRRVVRLVAHVVVGLSGVALLVWGGELVARTWSHVIPTLGLPRGVAYLPLPLSGVLMALFATELILEDSAGEESADMEMESGQWS